MFVVNDGLGNRLEAFYDQLLDLLVAIIDLFLTVAAHKVELHTSQVPLTAKLVIIVIGGFLDRNIGQVHEGV